MHKNEYLQILSNLYQVIVTASKPKGMCCFHCMDSMARFHPFNQRGLACIQGIVHCIHTRLVQLNRVRGCENTDIAHFRIMRMGIAVAVHRKPVCHINVNNPAASHKIHY